MEDYTALPCNDATEVDKHVYETPMDEGGYAMAFSDVGEYDNPDEVCACVCVCACACACACVCAVCVCAVCVCVCVCMCVC